MLKEIISAVLEKSDYKITEKKEGNDNVLHIKLNDSGLKVSVNPQHTFNINGSDKNQKKELNEYLEKEIRLPVRRIALKKFNEGVKEWNKWKKTHGQLSIDFSQIKLADTDLFEVNFQNVDLSYSEFHNVNLENSNLHNCNLKEAKLIGCNLKRANLSFVDGLMANFTKSDLSYSKLSSANLNATILRVTKLHGTVLQEVNFKNADLTESELFNTNLSGCIINTETVFKNTKGIELGINGIWNAETDSAALYSQSPPGNSMKGPNVEAVLESLKRARKYFGFSFLLSLGALLIFYLKQDSTSIPFLGEFELTKIQYLYIGMVFSLGLLVLTKSFLDDAFEGMKYLEDRKSAMSAGSFPWALTNFSGEKIDQIIISIISRVVLCLHPLFYLFLFDYSKVNYFLIGFLILLTIIGIWILFFSTNFQKPILFDQKTEEEKSKQTIVEKLDSLGRSLKYQ